VPSNRLRLSVIGHAGSGKSTFASFVEEAVDRRGLTRARVKLAKPLYDLQAAVYQTAGVSLSANAQDQVLMESLATALRRIRPESLVDDFLRRLASCAADVVINDDLRDPHIDAVVLRRAGFRIVRVTADDRVRVARLAARGDLSRSDRSTSELDLIKPDAIVDNSGELDEYRRRVDDLVGGWL
jgi:molybdopterin-guanine dinucleotide biosynthesis protein